VVRNIPGSKGDPRKNLKGPGAQFGGGKHEKARGAILSEDPKTGGRSFPRTLERGEGEAHVPSTKRRRSERDTNLSTRQVVAAGGLRGERPVLCKKNLQYREEKEPTGNPESRATKGENLLPGGGEDARCGRNEATEKKNRSRAEAARGKADTTQADDHRGTVH